MGDRPATRLLSVTAGRPEHRGAPERPVRALIGGGIGSGKSEVGRMLAERGFEVLDADRVGHEVLMPGHPVAARVAKRWPEALVDDLIDRAILGRIVFWDPAYLSELEALTHPAIRRVIEEWSVGGGERPAAVEVSVLSVMTDLAGDGWTRVVVDASAETRRGRLRRRGMTEADIEARMSAQPSRREWLATADLVVDNNAGQESLTSEVGRLVRRLNISGRTDDHG